MKFTTHHFYRAFTLIELLIALMIMALLLLLAVPKLNNWQKNNERLALAHQLVAAIELAKTEALKRSKRVILCGSENGESCSDNWSAGFIMFVVNGYNQSQRVTEDELIKRWSITIQGKLSWRGVVTKWLAVYPANDSRLMAGTFFFQPYQDNEPSPLLMISRIGRVRLA